MVSKLLLYYNTLKYLKPVQVYGRVFSALKKYLPYELPGFPSKTETSLMKKTGFIFHDPWNKPGEIKKNKFCFLNHSIDFGSEINWNPDADLLWQFNLHYFNYLFLLSKEDQVKICNEWINRNSIRRQPGWHPYPLSLRITNWCKAELDDPQINKSLYMQAAFLSRNCEYYHPANHYLENARALIFAGLFFKNEGEAGKWLEKGISIIRAELPRQVLPDGGYFEKSIMYHSLMLGLVLDLINVLPESSGIYSLLRTTSEKMIDFLTGLTHPDGNISLFNDSTEEIAPSTKTILEYGGRLGFKETDITGRCLHAYPASGYYIFKDENIYLAIDGGSIGPDFIPAHSHADIFSYELSFSGKKFITDSGVYEYKEGELRDYARSTGAHNTLRIDRKSQAELWGSFRAARRYSPEQILFSEADGGIAFSGIFKGFTELIGDRLIHKRKITYDPPTAVLFISDSLEGTGNHLAESFIHLHPDVKIDYQDRDLLLEREGTKIKIIIREGEYKIGRGLFFPQFGKKEINKVIILSAGAIPFSIKYSVQLISK